MPACMLAMLLMFRVSEEVCKCWCKTTYFRPHCKPVPRLRLMQFDLQVKQLITSKFAFVKNGTTITGMLICQLNTTVRQL